MKLKRKIISLLLVLSMVVGSLPVATMVAEASDDITVYVTVIDKGAIADGKDGSEMMQVPMKVPEGSLVIDAVKATHVQYHPDGANAYSETSNFFSKFWGEDTYNSGYRVNGVGTNDPATETISNGDYLDMMLYEDYSTDEYANFETRSYAVAGGDPVPLKVSVDGVFGGEKSNEVKLLYSNDGSVPTIDTGKSTDTNGEATLYFSKAGTYYVMAQKEGTLLISSIAKVVVTGDDTAGQTIVDEDKEALTFDAIKGENTDFDKVTNNIVLPVVGDSGKSTISWTSSNENVISSKGIVSRPPNTASDAQVTLTAAIEYGNFTDTKDFVLTVSKFTRTNEEIIDDVIAELPTEYEATEWTGAENDVEGDKNIITKITELVKTENTSLSVNSSATVDSAQTAIAADGTITYGSDEVVGNVTITLAFGGTEKTHTIEVTVPEKQETKQDAYNATWLTFDAIKGENTGADNVTQTLLLPEKDPEGYYTELTWSVDTGYPNYAPSDAITISSTPSGGNYIATLNRPAVGEDPITVSLSATIKGGLYWDFGMSPPGPMPSFDGWKGFTITILPLTQAEIDAAQEVVDEAIELYTLDDITVRGTDDKADLANLKYHIDDIPLNWNYIDNEKEEYRDIEVTWTTTNPGFKDGKISGGAEVVRSDADQTGKITLTLSYGGATATKEWDTTVKAWTTEEAEAENKTLTDVKNALDFDEIKGSNTSANSVSKTLEVIDGATIANDGSIVFETSTVYHEKGADITWTSSDEKIVKEGWNSDYTEFGFLITQPIFDTEVTLTATLDSPMYSGMTGVTPVTKDITFTVAGKYGEKREAKDIIDNVEASAMKYIAEDNENAIWFIADLVAAEHSFTAVEKEEYAAEIITNSKNLIGSGNLLTANEVALLSRYVIALSALGYDASDITVADGTTLDLTDKLVDNTTAKTSYFVLPYVLIALQQNSNYATTDEINTIKGYIMDQKDGWMSTGFGTDGMTPVILALSPYYGEAEVKTAIDEAVVDLKAFQKENGALYSEGYETYGASSTGLAIAALVSIGVDPETITHGTSGASLVDGVTSYYDEATGKITPTSNSFGTEQGLRGLIAATNYTSGSTYNVFDFSAVNKVVYEEDVTVTFVANGGASVKAQTIESGQTAMEPTGYTKDGYNFGGWYTSSKLEGAEYDFTSAVTKNITLYAKWIPVKDVVEAEQAKIENLDASDSSNKDDIVDAAKSAIGAVQDANIETVRNDQAVLDSLKVIEEKVLEAYGVSVESPLPTINSDVEEKDKLPAQAVGVTGLALSILDAGMIEEIKSVGVNVVQSKSVDGKLILDITPIVTDTLGTVTTISNDNITAPVTLKIYLNDNFEGERVSILHKFTGGGQEIIEADIMEDANGKYIEFTVTKFSAFEISAIDTTGLNLAGTPLTGDNSNLLAMTLLLLVSLVGMAAVICRRKFSK